MKLDPYPKKDPELDGDSDPPWDLILQQKGLDPIYHIPNCQKDTNPASRSQSVIQMSHSDSKSHSE